MDAYDFTPDPEEDQTKRPKPRGVIFKLGAYYFLASTLCLIGFFILTYLDPNNTLNPLPPAASSAQEQAPALPPTDIPESIPEADAPTPTFTPVPPTATQSAAEPTATIPPFPTATEVILVPDEPTATPGEGDHFAPQIGSPAYLAHSEGCDGLYVAGFVIDIDNNPLVHMTVKVTGEMNGEAINLEALSGSNTNYTASGWEIKLSDDLTHSSGVLFVGLYEQGAYDPVSDLVPIDTYNDCNRNLIVVNFIQDQ